MRGGISVSGVQEEEKEEKKISLNFYDRATIAPAWGASVARVGQFFFFFLLQPHLVPKNSTRLRSSSDTSAMANEPTEFSLPGIGGRGPVVARSDPTNFFFFLPPAKANLIPYSP